QRQVGLDRLESVDDAGEDRIGVVQLRARVQDLAEKRQPFAFGLQHEARLKRQYGVAAAEACAILRGEAFVACAMAAVKIYDLVGAVLTAGRPGGHGRKY